MKLKRLNYIAHQALRDTIRTSQKHLIDPFHHYTPEIEIIIDLKTGTYKPELDDDVKNYYNFIIKWFHGALSKESIPTEIITKATLTINQKGKECIIEAQGRKFRSSYEF